MNWFEAILAGLALCLVTTPSSAQDAPPAYTYATLSDGQFDRGDIGDVTSGATFQAGSIAKFACSVAALSLADQGRLELDAPIAALLPDLELGEAGQVTLRQVLQNRSGLRDGLMPAVREDLQGTLAIAEPTEAIRRFVAGDLARAPGEAFAYDHVNWIVVQAVLEQASREKLETLLQRLVLRPAGMEHSEVFSRQLGEGGQIPTEDAMPMPGFLQCAGGLASRPLDLIGLLRFTYKGGLSARALNQLTSVTTPEENYALGGRIHEHEGSIWSWQTGSNGPYKSIAIYDPVSDSGFAAMTATGDWAPMQAARDEWLAALSPDNLD